MSGFLDQIGIEVFIRFHLFLSKTVCSHVSFFPSQLVSFQQLSSMLSRTPLDLQVPKTSERLS